VTIIDEPPDFGIDNEPVYADLFPPATPPTPDELDSWAPVNLTGLPDQPPVQPTLGASTGVGLVYPGKRHVFSGPPESAKTIAAYAITLQVVRDGGRAVLIDFEMGGYDARNRLQDLGATHTDLTNILYLEPNEPATPDRIDRLINLQPHLVTVDAAAGAYDLEGLDDNKRQDVERLSRLYVTRFWRAGIATIFVDHVVKNTETRGKFVIGSERKLGGADVHIGFETITAISRGTKGLYKILTHKDRGGYLKRGHLANLDLASDPGTHAITWQFKPIGEDTAEAGYFRPTHLMEKVSAWLELQHEPVSRNAVADALGGTKEYVLKAIAALVTERYAIEQDGPRRSKLVSSACPYRESDQT
jgi:biotin operon repressor